VGKGLAVVHCHSSFVFHSQAGQVGGHVLLVWGTGLWVLLCCVTVALFSSYGWQVAQERPVYLASCPPTFSSKLHQARARETL
jgi:hypothetical protein